MRIEEIEVSNFKSFKHLKVNLKDLTVIIGPNTSGKTNFLNVFKFLKDILSKDLQYAITQQGGVKYLRNLNIGAKEDLKIKFSFKGKNEYSYLPHLIESNIEGKSMNVEILESNYEFNLSFKENNESFYEISKDKLISKGNLIYWPSGEYPDEKNSERKGTIEITIEREGEKFTFRNKSFDKTGKITKDEKFRIFPGELVDNRLLLLESAISFLFFPARKDIFRDLPVYNINPNSAKYAVSLTEPEELKEDGSNISVVLNKILKNENEQRKFSNLLRGLLDYIEKINVEPFINKHVQFTIHERFTKDDSIPAFLISEGTINVLAMIIILFIEKKNLVIIEEPERNIHPYLMSGIVDYMKDASRNKQIIVTTHNPEFVKHVGIENMLLISRDENGFSVVSRPSENEEVKHFLKKEIGIQLDDLFINNMLHD